MEILEFFLNVLVLRSFLVKMLFNRMTPYQKGEHALNVNLLNLTHINITL